MRFALDDRAPAGADLRGAVGDRAARRGRRLRGALPLRPLPVVPGPRRAAARPMRGPCWPAWRARRRGSTWARSCRRSRSARPGNMAKVAITVDEMSGGRVELGVGAGWNEDEHRQYGFPFPPIEERAEMLEEQLEIVARPLPRRGRLVVPRPPLHRGRRAVPAAAGRPVTRDPRGRAGHAPLDAHRRALRRRVQHHHHRPGQDPRGLWLAGRGVPVGRARPGVCHAVGDGRRAGGPRRRRGRPTHRRPRRARSDGGERRVVVRRATSEADRRHAR